MTLSLKKNFEQNNFGILKKSTGRSSREVLLNLAITAVQCQNFVQDTHKLFQANNFLNKLSVSDDDMLEVDNKIEEMEIRDTDESNSDVEEKSDHRFTLSMLTKSQQQQFADQINASASAFADYLKHHNRIKFVYLQG